MNLEIIENIINFITNNGEGATFESILRFCLDAFFTLLFTILFIVFVFRHIKSGKLKIIIVLYLLGVLLAYLFNMKVTLIVLSSGIIIFGLLFLITISTEYRNMFTTLGRKVNEKKFVQTEEDKQYLIDTLVKTCEYLSMRRIGAIITIEKENSLNSFITKAVKIDSVISFELLATIFFPNTALHDGAVIIRGNQIMCAGAFYPSSENTDIPRSFGSRHRAGLGISEVSDSYTIVVSEETGNISTMSLGTINPDLSSEKLRSVLEQNIIVK